MYITTKQFCVPYIYSAYQVYMQSSLQPRLASVKKSNMNMFLSYISPKICNFSKKTTELEFPSIKMEFPLSEYLERFKFQDEHLKRTLQRAINAQINSQRSITTLTRKLSNGVKRNLSKWSFYYLNMSNSINFHAINKINTQKEERERAMYALIYSQRSMITTTKRSI